VLTLFKANIGASLLIPHGHPFAIFTKKLVTTKDFELECFYQIFIKFSKQPLYFVIHHVENP
jgi:hypothetical protein